MSTHNIFFVKKLDKKKYQEFWFEKKSAVSGAMSHAILPVSV